MQPKPYCRKANYYETDQMGIIHHSNYIRWFEEARIDWMEQVGLSFAQLGQDGVSVPVVAASCEYHSMVRFGDTVDIHIEMPLFTGTRMSVTYRVVDCATGTLRATGETRHCFLNAEGRPSSLKKIGRVYYDRMLPFVHT